jgi:hypothetical protein
MTDQTDAGHTERPQTVIGPITLGGNGGPDAPAPTGGVTIVLDPNSVIGLAALGFGGVSSVEILQIRPAAGVLTLTVAANGGPSTIAIDGTNYGAAGPACPPGSALTAIGRSGSDVVLHVIEAGQLAYPAYPAQASVTVTVSSPAAI